MLVIILDTIQIAATIFFKILMEQKNRDGQQNLLSTTLSLKMLTMKNSLVNFEYLSLVC